MRRKKRATRSLRWDVILNLISGELVLATVLVATIGAFSLINVAQQRAQTIQEVSGVVAAGMMPLLADQQEAEVKAQLSSILEATKLHDIENISIVDSSGAVIASYGNHDMCTVSALTGTPAPLAILTDCQLVRKPIVIDGLTVATVYVSFGPLNLGEWLRMPGMAAVIVVLSVMLVSAPWSAWRFTHVFVEPIRNLSRHASRIADGDMERLVATDAVGEIGELQDSLNRMATQLKAREDELISSYEALATAYDSLQQATQEIEQLAALKTDFVAVAAHEIRSPLSTISLYSELLEAGELAKLNDTEAESVAAIGAAAARLNAIASDLMDAALLERGMLPVHFTEMWIDEVLTEAVADARLMAKSRDIDITAEEPMPEMVVQGDPLRLRQVFDNLLSNAVKYSPRGTSVTVSVRENGDSVEIDISDRGRGILEEDRQRIFTLFVRLDLGNDRDTGGLGLGLAISARIVEAHGGTIGVYANEAGGSTFTVTLPTSGTAESRTGDSTITVVRRERT